MNDNHNALLQSLAEYMRLQWPNAKESLIIEVSDGDDGENGGYLVLKFRLDGALYVGETRVNNPSDSFEEANLLVESLKSAIRDRAK